MTKKTVNHRIATLTFREAKIVELRFYLSFSPVYFTHIQKRNVGKHPDGAAEITSHF